MKKIKVSTIIMYTILIIGAIIMLFPFFWMIGTSFKELSEVVQSPPTLFPKSLQLANYKKVFDTIPFGNMYWNTIVTTVVSVICEVVISAMAAYVFARIHFPGRDIIFVLILSLLMIPGALFSLPRYLMMTEWGLLNTKIAVILPGIFSAYNTFQMRQHFMALPRELEDAARLDGCNHFGIFSKIMLPLVKPGLISAAILSFRANWNNFLWPNLVNTSQEKMTLAVGLLYFKDENTNDYHVAMAAAVMAIIPLLVVFLISQKRFIEGEASTGIKG